MKYLKLLASIPLFAGFILQGCGKPSEPDVFIELRANPDHYELKASYSREWESEAISKNVHLEQSQEIQSKNKNEILEALRNYVETDKNVKISIRGYTESIEEIMVELASLEERPNIKITAISYGMATTNK